METNEQSNKKELKDGEKKKINTKWSALLQTLVRDDDGWSSLIINVADKDRDEPQRVYTHSSDKPKGMVDLSWHHIIPIQDLKLVWNTAVYHDWSLAMNSTDKKPNKKVKQYDPNRVLVDLAQMFMADEDSANLMASQASVENARNKEEIIEYITDITQWKEKLQRKSKSLDNDVLRKLVHWPAWNLVEGPNEQKERSDGPGEAIDDFSYALREKEERELCANIILLYEQCINPLWEQAKNWEGNNDDRISMEGKEKILKTATGSVKSKITWKYKKPIPVERVCWYYDELTLHKWRKATATTAPTKE